MNDPILKHETKKEYVEIQSSFDICNRYRLTSFRTEPISDEGDLWK